MTNSTNVTLKNRQETFLLTLIPTPIGNIGDITLRAIEALGDADTLLCEDTRVTKKLIQILKERYGSSFKPEQNFISLHSHNEKEFIQNLTPAFFEQNVVYVSDAGMPGISDPGQVLVRYAQENGIKYDVLPGANALLTAFVASGFVETKMLFWGFLPHKGKDRAASLQGAL
ncbi:MAG: rRNA (cytidine1402-2-O)-methyltransferase, partial [Campylobacterota bacterium]|nr:rRNA (cytidine1402-2-O)-methyltransferase [Campylobacterota bacterium]